MGLLILIISCAPVEIKDSEWWGSLGFQGAQGVHTLSNSQETITWPQFISKWTDPNHPLICTEVDNFLYWKDDIEKLCTEAPCTYQQSKQIKKIVEHIEKLKSLVKKP